ncbi:MAG: hypothetical protein ACREEN_00410 [Stellaceae bacterium]
MFEISADRQPSAVPAGSPAVKNEERMTMIIEGKAASVAITRAQLDEIRKLIDRRDHVAGIVRAIDNARADLFVIGVNGPAPFRGVNVELETPVEKLAATTILRGIVERLDVRLKNLGFDVENAAP